MRFRNLLLLPALALAAACSSNGPTTVVGFDGSLVFTYTGSQAGSFSASGSVPTSSAEQATTPWAAATASGTNEMALAAASPRSASTHDFVDMVIQRNTVGTATIASSCSSNCNFLSFIIGHANTGSGYTASCYLSSGTIAITDKTDARMKGTFNGSGQCVGSTGTPGAITVTNGTFDVAIISNVP